MSAFYAKGAQRILTGTINLSTANIKVALVKNTYIQDLDADEFYSDISAHVVSTPVALTGKAVAGRTFDADDATFVAVPVGDVCEAIVFYVDTGSPATSPLFLYVDDVAAFPFTGNGDNQLMQWSNGAYKIVSL